MRNAFIRGLTALAQADPRVMLLTGDLGFKLFDSFATLCPKRFLNAGVAEANMIGVAAGLAMGGLKPFTYSIVPFATLRCFEQIRDDVCYHNLPVRIVGVGGGYSYGPNGATHHALEDIAAMRVLPNLTVVCPGDPVEAELAVLNSRHCPGPLYLRLGRAGDPVVHTKQPPFRIGKAITVQAGGDCALVSTGGALPLAVATAAMLRARHIHARVLSMHTVKPLDEGALKDCARTGAIFTLEEHSRIGGLGSAIGEWLAAAQISCRWMSFGTDDRFEHTCGSQQWMCEKQGLTPERISARIAGLLQESREC